jgi:hypothetical protein
MAGSSQVTKIKENQGRFKTGIGYYHYIVNDDGESEFAKGQLTIGKGNEDGA